MLLLPLDGSLMTLRWQSQPEWNTRQKQWPMRQRGWPFPAQGSGMELTLKKSSYGIAGALGHAGEKPQSERKKRCSAALFI